MAPVVAGSTPVAHPTTPRRFAAILLPPACLALGCWQSYAMLDQDPDGAGPADVAGPADDAAPGDDAPPPHDAGGEDVEPSTDVPICPVVEVLLDVPVDGCASRVVESTEGNVCGWDPDTDRAARAVLVQRTRSGTPWSVLIRSRSATGEGIIAYGFPAADDCSRCEMRGSATGGDLRLHGVGGDLPTARDEVLVVLDHAGAAMWIQACDP